MHQERPAAHHSQHSLEKHTPMLIRAGFEISYDCPQPTPMLLALSIHPSRLPDVIGPHQIVFDPPIGATPYRDSFGNICTRIVAPAGRITMSKEVLVRDP